MSDTNYGDEHMVTRSCTWCSEDMPMDADVSALIEDDELFCNACTELADPFADIGLAIAWPDCGEHVYRVQRAVTMGHIYQAGGDIEHCLWLASLETVTEYAYGHTSNQRLNSLVSSAACKWNHNMTEHIALSTN